MTIPAFDHQAVLSAGYGVIPRCIASEWTTIVTVGGAEGAQNDTTCTFGQGLLFLLCTTGAHFLRLGLYETSGDSAGGGQLLAPNLWPMLRGNAATEPRFFAVNIQGTRNRYFRCYTDTNQTLYWKFERS